MQRAFAMKKYPQNKYYLHWKLRKAGVKISRKQKTIFIPANEQQKAELRQVKKLQQKYNYEIQLTIK